MHSSFPNSTVDVFPNVTHACCVSRPTNYLHLITTMLSYEAQDSYSPHVCVTSSFVYLNIPSSPPSSSSMIRYLIVILPLGRGIILRDLRKPKQTEFEDLTGVQMNTDMRVTPHDPQEKYHEDGGKMLLRNAVTFPRPTQHYNPLRESLQI